MSRYTLYKLLAQLLKLVGSRSAGEGYEMEESIGGAGRPGSDLRRPRGRGPE